MLPRYSGFSNRYEAVLAEPSDVLSTFPSKYLAPEILAGHGQPSAAADAYAFAKFALDAIAYAEAGLYDQVGTGDRVFYVEILLSLEAILGAAVVVEDGRDAGKGENGNGSAPADYPVSGRPAGDRIGAMDCFIRLLRDIVTGSVSFHGEYPVPESSRLYDFPSAFPCVFSQLFSGQGVGWFERGSVRLYWIFDPGPSGKGWLAGDEEDDGDDDSGSDWSDGDSDGARSCETDITIYSR